MRALLAEPSGAHHLPHGSDGNVCAVAGLRASTSCLRLAGEQSGGGGGRVPAAAEGGVVFLPIL